MSSEVSKAAVQLVSIAKIEVGWRRRKKLGPIAALTKSIELRGLIHPITVNADHQLVCGQRRLEACKRLGWSRIPARVVDVAEGERLRDMELDENAQRLDLDEYEASKERLREWEAEAEAIAESEGFRTESVRNPRGGRPAEPTSARSISKATGVPVQTVKDTRRHVEAADEYPILQQPGWKKYQALEAKELLDKIDPKAREAVVDMVQDKVLTVDGKNTKDALDLLRNVASKPKDKQRKIAELASSSDPDEQSLAITTAAARPPMPDLRVSMINDALVWLDKASSLKVDRMTGPLKAFAEKTRERAEPLISQLREDDHGRRSAV